MSSNFDLSSSLLKAALLLKNSLASRGSDDETWATTCIAKLNETWDKSDIIIRRSIMNGLVLDQEGKLFEGNPAGNISDAWGINLDVCKTYCGRDRFSMVTSFSRFAAGSTSYLLPWLALTAQLPYETGSVGADIMSVCVGLGSPMLMTISLMMTILNKRWIRNKFGWSISEARRNHAHGMEARAQAAMVIAENAQQVPVRLIQRDGWLARQIALDVYTAWWVDAARSVESTRRGVTSSLVAQLSVAIISWILTVVGSLTKNVGDTTEALALSSGSLWIWLVPVILGWILVGTQNKADTIGAAIGSPRSSRDVQCGIHVATGDFLADPISVSVNAQQTANGTGTTRDRIDSRQKFWNVDVYGYQKQQGPAFNYARALTWINFADRLHDAFDRGIGSFSKTPYGDLAGLPDKEGNNVHVSEACGLLPQTCNPSTHLQTPPTPNPPQAASAGSPAWSTEPVPKHDLREYPALSEVSSDARSAFWQHLAFSVVMGVFLQWGTTSLAFSMAYETVVKGLGCRSGAYLLYGIASTLGCFFMLLSAALSHATMRGYELGSSRRDTPLVGAFAVTTLLLGRFLLVANTAWLLLISIWELVGFFDSCYCASTQFSKGDDGWVLLFKTMDQLKDGARTPWGVCVGVGLAIVLLAILVFSVATQKPKEQ